MSYIIEMKIFHLLRYEYGRSGNPTRDVLEKQLAAIEGATTAITFASGVAATTAITTMLSWYVLKFKQNLAQEYIIVTKATI